MEALVSCRHFPAYLIKLDKIAAPITLLDHSTTILASQQLLKADKQARKEPFFNAALIYEYSEEAENIFATNNFRYWYNGIMFPSGRMSGQR